MASTTWPATSGNGAATGIARIIFKKLAESGNVARNPQGPEMSFDPAEPKEKKRVQKGGSYLCTDQYCTRYMVGARGKGEVNTGTLGFRCADDGTKRTKQPAFCLK
jgi:sulfatase modifying factor 1